MSEDDPIQEFGGSVMKELHQTGIEGVKKMKNIKLMLLGIAVILFGMSAILISGLQGTPNFHNGIYELLGVVCPFAGVALVVIAFFMKDNQS